jgi:hypothetical protein
MNTDIYTLGIKALAGEQLTDEERTRLQKRNAKYEFVRFLYMEKMADAKLVDFHFTPGEGFETTPTIDIVNELLKFNLAIKNGNVKPLNFGDSKWINNPPSTGRTKTTLK